jgi:hypothetical protein
MSKQERKPHRLLVRRRTAAEMLDTSISRLKRLEQSGRLKAIRIGGGRDVHYESAEIERLARGEASND